MDIAKIQLKKSSIREYMMNNDGTSQLENTRLEIRKKQDCIKGK